MVVHKGMYGHLGPASEAGTGTDYYVRPRTTHLVGRGVRQCGL
jgi:hypothetical protein